MGTTPTQLIQADMNGTGTGSMIDITSYVLGQSPIQHTYGRSTWSAQVQPAGTLTFTLDNPDGRFTPGATTTYAVGLVRNTLIKWTCGARVRYFHVTTIGLEFPHSTSNRSMVTVNATDLLGLLSQRPMMAMVREATLAKKPVAFWPMSESSGADAMSFADVSGNQQPSQYVATKVAGVPLVFGGASSNTAVISPATGRGPSTDGAAALVLNENSGVPIDTFSATVRRGLTRNILASLDDAQPQQPTSNNRQLTIPDRSTPISLLNPTYPMSGWNQTAGWFGYAVSIWFSMNDIYGGVPGATTGAGGQGPYVQLFTIDGPNITVTMRIYNKQIVVHSTVDNAETASSWSVTPNAVHHLAIAVVDFDKQYNGGVYASSKSQFYVYLDGNYMGALNVTLPAFKPPTGITLGAGGANLYKTGSTQTCWAFAGSISNVSIHGPTGMVGTGNFDASEIISTGTTGPVESVATRLGRILAWCAPTMPSATAMVGYTQGTQNAGGNVGPHDTAGKDALTVAAEVCACDDAQFTADIIAGSECITAWLDTMQRPLTPVLTIDADADVSGAPVLGFDLTGVVQQATASTYGQASTFVGTGAPTRWQGSTDTVKCATNSAELVRQLAAYRVAKGRAQTISPTSLVVDATTSENDVTATLLGLYPGATVAITGLPSDKLGYTSISCLLIGVTEEYTVGRSAFTLQLMPRFPEMYFDPLLGTEGPWRFIDEPTWAVNPVTGNLQAAGASGSFMGVYSSTTGAALTSGTTSAYIISNRYTAPTARNNTIPTTFFSTDAGDYPLTIKVDNEQMTISSPAGSPTSTTINGGTCWYQAVTLTRGVNGTAASAHAAFTPTSISGDQGLQVAYPYEYSPLLAF